jgi:hypothetical protein
MRIIILRVTTIILRKSFSVINRKKILIPLRIKKLKLKMKKQKTITSQRMMVYLLKKK